MIPEFSPASFKTNPQIVKFDGLSEYLATWTDEQFTDAYYAYVPNCGKLVIELVSENYRKLSMTIQQQQRSLKWVGEIILGHCLAIANANVQGSGLQKIEDGPAKASFHKPEIWRAYFSQTGLGQQLVQMVDSLSTAQYFNAPDVLAEATWLQRQLGYFS